MVMKEISDNTDGKIYHVLDWKNQYCQKTICKVKKNPKNRLYYLR